MTGSLSNTANGLALIVLLLLSQSLYAIPSTADQHRLKHDSARDSVEVQLPSYEEHGAINIYEERIAVIEDFDGVYDEALIAQFIGLGMAHQNQGSSAEASRAFERALHVSRINHGLQNEKQIPLLNRLIFNYTESKNWRQVASRQEQLYALQRRLYSDSDPRLLPVIKHIVRRYIRAAEERFNSETISGLHKALTLQKKAEEIVEQHYGVFDPRLVDILYGQAIIQYHLELYRLIVNGYTRPGENESVTRTTSTFNQRGDPQFKEVIAKPYDLGRRALQRRLSIMMNSPDEETRILGMLTMGDWFLLFGKRFNSLSMYRQIFRQFGENEESRAFITELFEIPRSLNFSYETKTEDTGENGKFVEAKFDVSSSGLARRIEIVESNADNKEATTLKRKIRASRFRPRFENGQPVATEGVSYRKKIATEESSDTPDNERT